MKVAPKRGDGAQKGKKTAPRLEPEGLQTKSVLSGPLDSAPDARNQGQPRVARKPPPHVLFPARIRRQQISALLLHRHGGPCRTDDAETWFEEVAIHLVISCRAEALEFVAKEWAQVHTPGLSPTRIVEILAWVRAVRPFYQSEDVGRRLRLTYLEKVTLRITHIAAYDVGVGEAAVLKRASECERVNAHRWSTGKVKTPRSMSLAKRVPRLPGEGNEAFYKRAKAVVAAGLA